MFEIEEAEKREMASTSYVTVLEKNKNAWHGSSFVLVCTPDFEPFGAFQLKR